MRSTLHCSMYKTESSGELEGSISPPTILYAFAQRWQVDPASKSICGRLRMNCTEGSAGRAQAECAAVSALLGGATYLAAK